MSMYKEAFEQGHDRISKGRISNKDAAAQAKSALRKGQVDKVTTVTKMNAGANRGVAGADNPNYARIAEEDTGHYQVPRTSLDFGKALSKARMDAGMTQAQLAQKINEKPTVVQDYENGKAIPNGQVVQKMSRALGGVKLPHAKKNVVHA
eukprot:GHVH01009494.1.p1 GENE.GHVH01009494.1~~GHVH01009494.1.p1  ORF type:complete len:150 (+),score=12.53 GHVH01009494.1:60-509(+)